MCLSPLVRAEACTSLCDSLFGRRQKVCIFFILAVLGTQIICEIIWWQRISIKFYIKASVYATREIMSIEDSFLGARDQSRVVLPGTLQCLFKSDVLIFILSVVIQTFSILTGFLGFELHVALKYWFVLKMSRYKDSVVSLCFYFPLC